MSLSGGSSSTDSLPPPVLAEAADDGAPAHGAGPDDGGAARRRPVIGEGGDEARVRAKTAWGELAGLAIAVGGSSQLLGAPCVARWTTMASLWAYRREDWPGTWLWRRSNALFCCHRLSPSCLLGPIGPRKGWAEKAQGAPPRAPRGAVREGGARGARPEELVALAAFILRKPVRSVFSA